MATGAGIIVGIRSQKQELLDYQNKRTLGLNPATL
jgi:hypothetical protein